MKGRTAAGDASFRTSGTGAGGALYIGVLASALIALAVHAPSAAGRATAIVLLVAAMAFGWRIHAVSGVSLKGSELVAHGLFRTYRWRLEDIRSIRTELGPPFRLQLRYIVVVVDKAIPLPHVFERRNAQPSELGRFVELVRQRLAS
jgi:hypothetical protein